MLQDLRFGFKLLWKEKAFTITALLTLALCIGANTAILGEFPNWHMRRCLTKP